MHDSGDSAPRECGRISVVIARSEATKQSILPLCRALDCFASLAMTASGILDRPVKPGEDERVAV